MISMLNAELLGTTLMALSLVAGAALALWSLPWTDEDLDQVQRDANGVRDHLAGRRGDRSARDGRPGSSARAQVAA